MRRPLILPALVALLLASLQPLAAQSRSTQRIVLRYMNVEQMVTMLWGPAGEETGGTDFFQHFATDLVYDAAEAMPRSEGRWAQGGSFRTRPPKSGGNLSGMIPEGIAGRPLVVAGQNAMIVQGTRIAIDELAELIALLDVPTDMVHVDVRSVDLPVQEFDGWGLDWHWTRGDLEAGGGGDPVAGGLRVRLTLADTNAALSMVNSSSRGRHVQGASVTTFNNSPAEVFFGETVPFFTTVTEYDAFGYRRATTQQVDAIFLGVYLWVVPRINADNTVTMELAPELSEWAGEVPIPYSTPLPITRHQTVRTSVTVADGESMVIGGLLRDTDDINQKFGGMFSRYHRRLTSHPVLIVTPTIIRHQSLR